MTHTLTQEREFALLEALAIHRAMTIKQLVELIEAPANSLQNILGDKKRSLRAQGLAASSSLNPSGENIWHLTPAGAKLSYEVGLVDKMPVLEIPKGILEGGRFLAHHLTVNNVGLKFRAIARERGDEVDWENEVRHPDVLRPLVKADMVLNYYRGAQATLITRFIEVDRGSLPTIRKPLHKLIDKLRRYDRLMRSPELWADSFDVDPSYPRNHFPKLIVVMDGGPKVPKARLMERARTVSAALGGVYNARLPHSFVTLEDLMAYDADELVGVFEEDRELVS